jgi:lipid-binding SYLF domain-containing protein
MRRLGSIFILALVFSTAAAQSETRAASGKEIKERIQVTLKQLEREVEGAKDVLKKSKGVVVFPKVWKAGIGIGGEYGQGALLSGGKVVDYYSIAGGSIGFQLGVQKKSVVIVFMERKAFDDFKKNESGWEFGVDASAAVITAGVEGSITSLTHNEPLITFVIGQKGLMYNASLEGYKITKIKK